jgi:arabinofuranosyltransferase
MQVPAAHPTQALSEVARSSTEPTRSIDSAFTVLILVFCALFATHAWVVDDAYITFRTIDNFVHGHGLRWNTDERVQVYTHPLWMFVCAAVYAFSRDAFYTALGVSFVISLAALLMTARALQRHVSAWSKLVFLGLLFASKSFLDFSSSGLENPLTHLLIGAFFVRFLFPASPWAEAPPTRVLVLFLLAALGFANRADTLLVFAPACAAVLYEQLRGRGLAAFRPVLVGTAPALAWVLFALFYYGSALPNTAYAKLIGPRITRAEQYRAGAAYYLDSLLLDPATLVLFGVALIAALRSRRRPELLAAAGLLLYGLYVLMSGAVGTHMSGRFFSGLAFLSAFLIAVLIRDRGATYPLLGFALLVVLGSPFSPLRVGTSLYGSTTVTRLRDNVIDTREYVLREGAALLNFAPDVRLPNHGAFHAGTQFRSSPKRVHEGGPGRGFGPMVGYSGYAAGPQKHIVDVLGLTDPLVARLPIPRKAGWRPGHFFRVMPAGYLASVEARANLIEDPDLHRYYDVIELVTRGPLLSSDRLLAIWRLNTGHYDHLLHAYARRHELRWR